MLLTTTRRSRVCHLFACLLLLSATLAAQAQKQPTRIKHDSTYYKTYPHQITGRVYLSKKYTTLALEGPEGVKALRYRPHTPLTMGVGVTYGIVTLNV